MSEENHDSMELVQRVVKQVKGLIPAQTSRPAEQTGLANDEQNSRFVDVHKLKMDERGIGLLKEMYEIFSPSGGEHAMVLFVSKWLSANGIKHKVDSAGNIYAHNKVRGSKRILINAHMDTVASAPADIEVVHSKKDAILRSTNNQVIGGDDKNGVWCVLRLLTDPNIDTPLTALLCVSEESGCNGSEFAMDNHADYFDDCVFCLTIDRRGKTDIIYENFDITLCSDEIKKLLLKWGKPWELVLAEGSISDVSNIVKQLEINGINLFAGYYNAHMGTEHTSMHDLLKSYQFQKEILPKLHKQFMMNPKSVKFTDFNAYTYSSVRTYNTGPFSAYGSSAKSRFPSDTKSTGVYSENEIMDAFEQAIDDIDTLLGTNLLYYDFLDAHYELSHSKKSLKVLQGYALYPQSIDKLSYYFTINSNANRDAIIPVAQIMNYQPGEMLKSRYDSIDKYDYTY